MRTVLITGATSGIGKACVEKFSREGFKIIAIGRNEKKLIKLKKISLNSGANSFVKIKCDFNNEKEFKKLIINLKKIKNLDCLINCAGIALKSRISSMDLKEWNMVMKINLSIPFFLIKNLIKQLSKSKNASIINISSIAGRNRSISLGCHYTTSKAGLIGLTRHLASELGKKNIRVNCTTPGQTHTPMLKSSLSRKRQIDLAKTIPLKRLSMPSDQAEVIYFLSTKEASYINGAVIDVNGGIL